ncbi:MAG: CapA family protein [bacterium]
MRRGVRYIIYSLLLTLGILGGIFLGSYQKGYFSHTYVAQQNGIAQMLPEGEKEITLLFVGDIMLSRGVAYQTEKNGGDGRYPFLRIADVVRGADIAFGNLEGPLSDVGTDERNLYSFRADPKMMEGLVYAGFDVLSLANNHIGDWGHDALSDTVLRLKAANILPIGAGENYREANKVVVKKIGNTRFGFLAYTNLLPERFVATEDRVGVSEWGIEKIKKDITLAKQKSDIVIVSFHWGEEYSKEPVMYQKEFARACIDAGADIIVGHHPHVVQPVERYKDGVIMYSLGNFVFDQNFSKETMRGLMVTVHVKEKKISDVQQKTTIISSGFQVAVEK